MNDRGAQIEGFFWLLVRLCALVFGYMMVLGGGLFALAFLVDEWRTGAIALNGQVHTDAGTRFMLIAVPIALALAGYGLTALARRGKTSGNADRDPSGA